MEHQHVLNNKRECIENYLYNEYDIKVMPKPFYTKLHTIEDTFNEFKKKGE